MSTQETAALIESVNQMTATVAGKMGQIDQSVQNATANFNQQIAEVIKSIPEPLTNIYVNNQTGNDTNTGLSRAAKVQTLDKALSIAATKKAVAIHLGRVPDAPNNPYYVYDKHKMNNIQIAITADLNDGYTEASLGANLENEFYKVPKIIFTHKPGRNYIGSIDQNGGMLAFGSYRLSVNLEWKVASGAGLAYDGNFGLRQNATALVYFSAGCKVYLNCDTSGAYYNKVGFIESFGTVRGNFAQGVEDKSVAQNNHLIGYWSAAVTDGTRLFVEAYSGSRPLADIIKDYAVFGTVPFTQIAKV